MFHVFILVILFTQGCFTAPHEDINAIPRAGFSSACRAPRSIQRMVQGSEVVVEAGVIEVSPVRNNIYAVTLQVLIQLLIFLTSFEVYFRIFSLVLFVKISLHCIFK